MNVNHSNTFLDPSSEAKEIKTKINKWDLIKLTSFCTVKETINKSKRQLKDWEKISASDVTDKGVTSKIHKQLLQFNNNNNNTTQTT